MYLVTFDVEYENENKEAQITSWNRLFKNSPSKEDIIAVLKSDKQSKYRHDYLDFVLTMLIVYMNNSGIYLPITTEGQKGYWTKISNAEDVDIYLSIHKHDMIEN